MKVPVSRTVITQQDIEFPIYGGWEDDVNDGRTSWETRFYINEKLEYRDVTRRLDDGREEWEAECSSLNVSDVGSFLKHERLEPSAFWEWVEKMRTMLAPPGQAELDA